MSQDEEARHRDIVESLRLKGEALMKADENARAEYKAKFYSALIELAVSGEPFTSEDIIEMIGLPRTQIQANRNNAVGALMNGAARRGLIRKTGMRVLSTRPRSHGAELAEWVGTMGVT